MKIKMISFMIISFMIIMVLFQAMVAVAISAEEPIVQDTSREWYRSWSLDSNRNRIDDRLESELEENEYQGTYPVFIDFLAMPLTRDKERLVEMGLEINYVAKYMPTIAVRAASYEDIITLTSLPEIVMIERDYPIFPVLDTSTPAVKARNSTEYSPDAAWEEGYTGKDVVIAILDTGVDDNHESLDGKYVAGVDVSNQGFDVNGNPDDGNGHGSHCAGIVMGNGGATDDNGDGEPDYMGTAPDALLVDVKIGTDLGGNLGNNIIRGIEWCRDHKDEYNITILSISWGSQSDSDGQDAVSRSANEAVLEDGLFIVAAAGNDGPNNNGFGGPAAADEVITVGSVDNDHTITRTDDEIASYSNRGPRSDDGDDDQLDELKPDLCAPGTDIKSVRYSEFGQGNPNVQGQYINHTGTSMACPHISGIIALMLEANPDLTPSEVKEILHITSEKRGEPYDPDIDEDYSKDYGWGIVDAFAAVIFAREGELPGELVCSIESPEDGQEVNGTIDITGKARASPDPVEKVEIRIDGDDWSGAQGTTSWSYQWDTTTAANGDHTILARAYDGENYSEVVSITLKVTNENGNENYPPIAVIDSIDPDQATEGDEVSFEGHGEDDDGSIIEYSWESDIDGALSVEPSFTTRDLSVGTHEVSFKVMDDNESWSEADTGTVTIEPEDHPPVAHIDNIDPDPAVVGEPILFEGHGEDDDGTIEEYLWESNIDGFLSDERSFESPDLSEGTHEISFKVRDNDGLWSDPVIEDLTIRQEDDENNTGDKTYPDLTLTENDISFSTADPSHGDTIIIFARIHNPGDRDSDARVEVWDGVPGTGTLIGFQQITVIAGGTYMISVSWPAIQGNHLISIRIASSEPEEQDVSNNKATTTLVVRQQGENDDDDNDISTIIMVAIPLSAGIILMVVFIMYRRNRYEDDEDHWDEDEYYEDGY